MVGAVARKRVYRAASGLEESVLGSIDDTRAAKNSGFW
jgi:hypothetical protein